MNEVLDLIKSTVFSNDLEQCVLSNPLQKEGEIKSITIRPLKNEKSEAKAEYKYKKHNNIKTIDFDLLLGDMEKEGKIQFKQIFIKLNTCQYQILTNKKGKSKIIKKEVATKSQEGQRTKKYIIPNNEPCDFLIEIGVMDKKGNVKSNQYKKFRQINRFLEMVQDLYQKNDDQKLHIVDFGCGKSYLTFALYYFFKAICSREISITGVDLKQEVIDHCNQMAEKLNYENLSFVHGFIHNFQTDKKIDLVVTLHACDTATDDAILFSLNHKAQAMMFVPCCQHELNSQLSNGPNKPMLRYGIFKDRLTALITDSMRAQLLEASGYKVQSMEFIDMEHTAKNILLRCKKIERTDQDIFEKTQKYLEFKHHWSIDPYLEKELVKQNYLVL